MWRSLIAFLVLNVHITAATIENSEDFLRVSIKRHTIKNSNTFDRWFKKTAGLPSCKGNECNSVSNTNTDGKVPKVPIHVKWTMYYGEITVGTPPQNFKVLFDSDIADLWIPSERCPFYMFGCRSHNRYNSNTSSTSEETEDIIRLMHFGFEGYIAKDTVCIDGACANQQFFAEVTSMPNFFIITPFDGLFGLGFPESSSLEETTVLRSLVQQKQIASEVAGLWLNRNTSDKNQGELTLGGFDKTKFVEPIIWTPITQRGFWQFHLDKINVDSTTLGCKSGCNVYATTRYYGIGGPQEEVDAINQQIGAFYIPYAEMYVVSCGSVPTLPKLSFVIGGKPFTLSGEDYILKWTVKGYSLCFSLIGPTMNPTMQDTWELGTVFVGRFYTAFDFAGERIGFANPKEF